MLGCVDILEILFVISAQAVIGTKMNGTTPTSSFPRRRESIPLEEHMRYPIWIPDFAGMTGNVNTT